MRLAINLCTRDRANLLEETITRTIENITLPETKLYVSIDLDDVASVEVINKLASERVIPLIEPREDSLGAKYNRVIGKGDVYLPMVDYSPILTKNFDQMFLDAAELFPDGFGWIYSHLANLSFPALQAVTHRTVEHLGYVYPDMFPYWFVDHWADDLARMTDRIAFVPVLADFVTRRPQSTLELRDLAFWAGFYDAQYMRRRKLALSIIWHKDFQEPLWRKRLLESRTLLIEERTLMINAQCRSQAAQVQMQRGSQEPSERYERIKKGAIAELEKILAELKGEQLSIAAE